MNPDGWDDPDKRDDALQRVIRAAARAPLVPEEWINRHIAGNWQVDRDPSHAELQVLQAFSYGLGYKSVGEVLGRSPNTVRSQIRQARFLLRAKTTAQAVAIAIRRGLID